MGSQRVPWNISIHSVPQSQKKEEKIAQEVLINWWTKFKNIPQAISVCDASGQYNQ